MKKIILSGYENVLDNEIFIKYPKDINGDAKILRINKFRHPTLDELLDKISLEAKRLIYYAGEEETSETNGLVELCKAFPKEHLMSLQDKNSQRMRSMRLSYQESYLQENKYYIEYIGGIVPNIILRGMEEVIQEKDFQVDADIYENVLIDKFGTKKGDIFLRLEDNKLPKKEYLDSLTQELVKTSGVLTILEDFGSYQRAKKHLDYIYLNNFNEIIPYLKDYSEIQIESRAFCLVENFAKYVLEEKMRKNLFNEARIIIRKTPREPGQGDVSLN